MEKVVYNIFMKNYLLIIAFVCVLSPVMADDEVYLDLNATEIHQYKTFSPDFRNEKPESDDYSEEKDMLLHPFQYIKEEHKDLYSPKTVTNKKEKSFCKIFY